MADCPSTEVIADARELRFPRFRIVVVDGVDAGRTLDVAATEIAIGTVDRQRPRARRRVGVAPPHRDRADRDAAARSATSAARTARSSTASRRARVPHGRRDDRDRHHEAALRGRSRASERAALSTEDRLGRALGTSDAMRRLFAMLPRLARVGARPSCSRARPAPARACSRRRSTRRSPRARGPFVVVDCGVDPAEPDRERAVRARARRVHRRDGGARRRVRGRARRHDLPRRDRRAAARHAAEAAARARGARRQARRRQRADPRSTSASIAATNRDLRAEVNRGRFRADLYYRLNIVPDPRAAAARAPRRHPAARRRTSIEQLAAGEDRRRPTCSRDLARHDWPGNVRELRSAVERTVLLGDPSVWRADRRRARAPAAARAIDPPRHVVSRREGARGRRMGARLRARADRDARRQPVARGARRPHGSQPPARADGPPPRAQRGQVSERRRANAPRCSERGR